MGILPIQRMIKSSVSLRSMNDFWTLAYQAREEGCHAGGASAVRRGASGVTDGVMGEWGAARESQGRSTSYSGPFFF